jgi:hypothetical protein
MLNRRRNGGVNMSQIDPWERAADCARAIQDTTDQQRSAILANLRELWLSLANERHVMTDDAFALEVETVGRLHMEWFGAELRASHVDAVVQ